MKKKFVSWHHTLYAYCEGNEKKTTHRHTLHHSQQIIHANELSERELKKKQHPSQYFKNSNIKKCSVAAERKNNRGEEVNDAIHRLNAFVHDFNIFYDCSGNG